MDEKIPQVIRGVIAALISGIEHLLGRTSVFPVPSNRPSGAVARG